MPFPMNMNRIEPTALLAITLFFMFFGWTKFAFNANYLYITDYAIRSIAILFIFHNLIQAQLPKKALHAIILSIIIFHAIIAIMWIEVFLYFPNKFFYNDLFPPIDEHNLKIIDLTFGLALVALSEEMVFRDLFHRCCAFLGRSPAFTYLASSIAFGLLHAPQGAALVMAATLSGLALMALYRLTASPWPCVAVHFAVDFVLLSDLRCQFGFELCR